VRQLRVWLESTYKRLQSCWSVPGADDELAGWFRAKQLSAVHRLIPITMTGNVITAALICYMLGKFVPVAIMVGWMLAVLGIAFGWVWIALRNIAQPSSAQYVSSRTQWYSIAQSTLMAVVWAAMSAYLMPMIDDDGRLLLASIITAFICVGSFGLTTLPQAGVAWVVVLCAGMGYGLLASQRDIYQLLAVLLVQYAGIVSAVVLISSRVFLARLQAEAETEKQKQLVDLLLHDFEEHASDWLWETDAQGKLIHVSVRLAEILRKTVNELMGAPLLDISNWLRPESSSVDDQNALLELGKYFDGCIPFRAHVIPVHVDGNNFWWSLTAKPLFDSRGELTGWRGIGSDVTEARRREREMQQLANFDSLTGLANRHQFRLSLDRALELAGSAPCALLMLDLDNFKAVNDSLGHGFGDRLLQVVAKRLKSRVKESDVLARLGGDEFALICPAVKSISDITGLPATMLDALIEPCYIDGIRMEMRASIGVALAPQDGLSAEALLKCADMALYAAKEAGRNTVCFYDAGMDERARHRITLQNDLANALQLNQFELHYQPQIDLNSNRITGFEALLRWRHPERGLVSPAEFIPVAEETGLIVAIGKWVLNAAMDQSLLWSGDFVIAVNLSAVQFRSGSVVEDVAEALSRTGLPPQRLELEITESSLVQDSNAARETLKALRDMSVRIALDDFGTGYSSLAYLRIFPLDRLKIDRSFVNVLDDKESSESHAIVRTIIHLAVALNLQTTAEGVETETQRDTLREKGCRDMQGFLVSRPLPADKVVPFIDGWNSQHAL